MFTWWISSFRGPLVAAPGQLEATSGNVCVYTTTDREGKYQFMLLDFEGAFGGTPRRLKEQWGKQWESIASQYAVCFTQMPLSFINSN
jgi:hypothetical protein